MHVYLYNPKDYHVSTRTITINARIVRDSIIELHSSATGVSKKFFYDEYETNEEYMNNEGWDGEQDLAVFRNHDLGVVLRVYETPYDEF